MRRMTPSQYASYIKQQQRRVNDAIRKFNHEVDRVNRANQAAANKAVREYNREVDRVNAHNRRVVENHNRRVRQENRNAKTAVDKYNRAVQTQNRAVEHDRQARLSILRSSTTTRYIDVRQSTFDLSEQFDAVQRAPGTSVYADLVTLSEREADNSTTVTEALLSDEPVAPAQESDNGVLEYLAGFSNDLCDRWRGALFSLSPHNPDAGRHFCTSAREIFTEILERSAPNEDVVDADPTCERAPNSTAPSRRAKLRFLLSRKGADNPQMVGFVEKDIDDVLRLFRVFNEATHGAAGKHGMAKLQAIRQRVEGGIMFLAAVAL